MREETLLSLLDYEAQQAKCVADRGEREREKR
jgi:hypothetical protein